VTPFEIEDGTPPPKTGRFPDTRLAALDDIALSGIGSGTYKDETEAAKALLNEYAGHAVTKDDGEEYRHKLKDVVKRIRNKLHSLDK
jgi:hypothetical protein